MFLGIVVGELFVGFLFFLVVWVEGGGGLCCFCLLTVLFLCIVV